MRPSTITSRDVCRWEDSFEEYLRSEKDTFIEIVMDNERGRIVWYCGEWFGEMLNKYGACDSESQAALFANGQRLAFTETEKLWDVTEESLAKFLQGRPDVPGATIGG